MQKYYKCFLNEKLKNNYIFLPQGIRDLCNSNNRVLQGETSFWIIKIRTLNDPDDIFLAYLGGASSKENCFELSFELGKSLNIKNGDYAKLVDIICSDIENSERLELEPKTHFDYKIIEANPDYFEENMLNQLLVAYQGMVFPFIFPDNSVANLRIVSGKTKTPFVINQDCEVEIFYKPEDKVGGVEEEKQIYHQFQVKLRSSLGKSMFEIPTLYVPKSFFENNRIGEPKSFLCHLNLLKPSELINREKSFYNTLFSRLCDNHSITKMYSNGNNHSNLIDQILTKFPYSGGFWVNIKMTGDNNDYVVMNDFYYKFNSIIVEGDNPFLNLFQFDFTSFNFSLYNEFLLKHLKIEFYYNERVKIDHSKIETKIRSELAEYIEREKYLILNNKFYFVLEFENHKLDQALLDEGDRNEKFKVIVNINLNIYTNEFMSFLVKIGKCINTSKYSPNYDNEKTFRSLVILNSKEIVDGLQIKFNNEVIIYCNEYFQNKQNRNIFDPIIESLFTSNSFSKLLESSNITLPELYKTSYNDVRSSTKKFFQGKTQNFISILTGQKLLGKTKFAKLLHFKKQAFPKGEQILQNEKPVELIKSRKKMVKYLNLNLIASNQKVFKRYLKHFFDWETDEEIIYIIDGLVCLSPSKSQENGNSQQKELINYMSFKLVSYIKIIRNLNQMKGNKQYVFLITGSVNDIPDSFKTLSIIQ